MLELSVPPDALLDDGVSGARLRGAGEQPDATWRARLRDDDGRVWRAVAPTTDGLGGAWIPAKSSSSPLAALASLRPVRVEVRVELPDGRATTREVTRRLLADGVLVRRWRDRVLTATLLRPSGDGPFPALMIDATGLPVSPAAPPGDPARGGPGEALAAGPGQPILGRAESAAADPGEPPRETGEAPAAAPGEPILGTAEGAAADAGGPSREDGEAPAAAPAEPLIRTGETAVTASPSAPDAVAAATVAAALLASRGVVVLVVPPQRAADAVAAAAERLTALPFSAAAPRVVPAAAVPLPPFVPARGAAAGPQAAAVRAAGWDALLANLGATARGLAD